MQIKFLTFLISFCCYCSIWAADNHPLPKSTSDTLKLYHKNGQLKSASFFIDSNLYVTKSYSKKGQVQTEETFMKPGKLLTKKKWYYHNEAYGYSMYTYPSKKAVLNHHEEFYLNGKLKFCTDFKNDLIKQGEHSAYYENGNMQLSCLYDNNKRNGIQTKYYPSGTIQSISKYDNGKLDSVETYFYDNGQIWSEIVNKSGKTMDIKSSFKKDGTPLEKGTLSYGNGTRRVYDENSNIIAVEQYKNGNLQRTFRRNLK